MSGGHYDYLYNNIYQIAEKIEQEADITTIFGENGEESVTRQAEEASFRHEMAKFLDKVAWACRSLEWLDSGDTSNFEKVVEEFELCRFNDD